MPKKTGAKKYKDNYMNRLIGRVGKPFGSAVVCECKCKGKHKKKAKAKGKKKKYVKLDDEVSVSADLMPKPKSILKKKK